MKIMIYKMVNFQRLVSTIKLEPKLTDGVT